MPDEATQEDKEAREKEYVRNVRLAVAILFGILLVIAVIVIIYRLVTGRPVA